MGVWSTSTPAGSDPISQGDDRIREFKDAVQEALRGGAAEGDEAVFPGASPSTAPIFRYRGLKGTTAARPTAAAGGLYYNTDTKTLQRSNGATWDDIYNSPETQAIHAADSISLASAAGVITLTEAGNAFHVSGTEAVTDIQGWTHGIAIVRFTQARTITYSGTKMVLFNAVNAVVAAGDIFVFQFIGANQVREIGRISAYGVVTAPTRQYFTSGAGATYTTPTGCRKIIVKMLGGGGGGGAATANAGTAGNDTSFNSIVAKGGGAGGTTGGAIGADGTGGAGAASLRLPGNGGREHANLPTVALGATTNTTGVAAPANSGKGGGPGTSIAASGAAMQTISAGYPGGGGEYVEFSISSPAATYTYTVGAAANGGSAGTAAGGAGGSGWIVVEEKY